LAIENTQILPRYHLILTYDSRHLTMHDKAH